MVKEENKETEAAPKKVVLQCGHENKHYIPPAGVNQQKLVCTLPVGHQPQRIERRGPKGEDTSTYEVIHSAPYQTMIEGVLRDSLASWTDAAGTAPDNRKFKKDV